MTQLYSHYSVSSEYFKSQSWKLVNNYWLFYQDRYEYNEGKYILTMCYLQNLSPIPKVQHTTMVALKTEIHVKGSDNLHSNRNLTRI